MPALVGGFGNNKKIKNYLLNKSLKYSTDKNKSDLNFKFKNYGVQSQPMTLIMDAATLNAMYVSILLCYDAIKTLLCPAQLVSC